MYNHSNILRCLIYLNDFGRELKNNMELQLPKYLNDFGRELKYNSELLRRIACQGPQLGRVNARMCGGMALWVQFLLLVESLGLPGIDCGELYPEDLVLMSPKGLAMKGSSII